MRIKKQIKDIIEGDILLLDYYHMDERPHKVIEVNRHFVEKYTTLFHTLKGCFDLLMDGYWRSYGEFEWGRQEIEFEQIDFEL